MIKEGKENTIKYIGEVFGRFSVSIDNPIETEFIMKLRYDALFVIGSDLATWTEQRAIQNGYTTRNIAELSEDDITELIDNIKSRYKGKKYSGGEIGTIDTQRIRHGLKEYTDRDESSWRTESAEYLWQFYSQKDAIVEKESLSIIENGQIKDIFLVTIDPYVATYKGPTLWGQPHGKGIAYWEDGTTCEGVFRCLPVFSRLHGEYLFNHPDGRTYTCMFSYGLRDGMGTFVWPDEAKYEGEWSAGLRNGKGIMTYPDGTTVSGEWRKDKFLNEKCLPEGIDDSIYQVPLSAYPYKKNNRSGSVIDNYAERIKGDD